MTTISTIGLYCALREAPFVVPRDYVEQYGRRDELRRYRLRRRAIDTALFRRWRDQRQAAPATSPPTRAAQATRIMQQMRSGPKQLRARAEELDARQAAKCQKREIDLGHDPSAQPDERQKSDRRGATSQRLSRPPFQPRDRF